ncbi:ribbon-helix-helix domain-containing protein [Natrinema thermotolerans]|uniref:ribbon-helix-helix domain-containing protein n=1 Tax=Natrinema thermotolerans TaxID=121872 RepID=UPI0006794CD5|nr:ribbon-helix-helix domain-containing protein [Natrinema thermotolerans]QCC57334.1 hypothetical protein DVR14_01245 [Natrinema thermotolerans]
MGEYVSIQMPDEMIEDIDSRVDDDSNRSQWLREAAVARINAEDEGEWESPNSYTVEKNVL